MTSIVQGIAKQGVGRAAALDICFGREVALHERVAGRVLPLHRSAGVGDPLHSCPLRGIHDVPVLLDAILLRSGYQADVFDPTHGLVERGDVIVVAHE